MFENEHLHSKIGTKLFASKCCLFNIEMKLTLFRVVFSCVFTHLFPLSYLPSNGYWFVWCHVHKCCVLFHSRLIISQVYNHKCFHVKRSSSNIPVLYFETPRSTLVIDIDKLTGLSTQGLTLIILKCPFYGVPYKICESSPPFGIHMSCERDCCHGGSQMHLRVIIRKLNLSAVWYRHCFVPSSTHISHPISTSSP